ncbi:monovalent cation/H+ antiporter subunit D [Paracoccus sediminis]|uniref:Monovalent cation/H+ antiporter subunit D n=1 Tax=Paracoccus sediminis TaxID=1214787 RepID=A0A238Y3P2_9RHOB|nr:monovalent cation/H+ antiporter subunit D [Paracoccus sediminis]TBN47235.1 monovalent cation/H+ antiporter subunit D [Paracoccus sediminis]SNR65592.1 multisubunit potassium/proton antiporter, PhaD subunit [Paracoccus sediminis]
MIGEHLIIAPILIPFVTGALMLLYDDRRRAAKFWLSIVSAAAQLLIAVQLVIRAKTGGDVSDWEGISFYLLGDWAAPYGIVLVLDRLAAMMLVLTGLLAIPSLVYAHAGWNRQGPHYYSLFQFLLMGLNGAFLTGDLFNLFVFFEILLAASYGLLLHGSGQLRVRAGMHYIAINLAASLLFLIGVSLIYGVTGTLNMAHLANLIAAMPGENRPLLHAAVAVLAVAFLVKAGSWPLSFWLPTAYMAAAAPVGAMFAIMTKVGIYAIVRLSMLLFGDTGGASAGFGAGILIILGMATVLFGLLGVLSSQGLGRMAAHSVLISSGTVLGITGFALAGGGPGMLAGALYYLVASTLATSALFLLIEPMSREDGGIAAMLALTADAYGLDGADLDEVPDAGLAIPATMTVLGICFALCVLMLAGLPPLPGFIGKIAMVQALMAQTALPAGLAWSFIALLILSGFATLIGMARIGIQTFWSGDLVLPRVLALEIAPVIALLAVLAMTTVKAEAMLRYTAGTAQALHDTAAYAFGVFATPRAADRAPDDQGDDP